VAESGVHGVGTSELGDPMTAPLRPRLFSRGWRGLGVRLKNNHLAAVLGQQDGCRQPDRTAPGNNHANGHRTELSALFATRTVTARTLEL
jgi:hypothetical protein